MVLFLGLAALIGGFIIVMPLFMEKYPILSKIDEKISPYKIIIGLSIMVIGAITFFVPYHGNGKPLIPVFGDLLPSIFAFFSGAYISVDFLESLKGVKGSFFERMKNILHKYQFPIGFASMFFGIIHWFLFKVVFF